jgi:hypothetical protein
MNAFNANIAIALRTTLSLAIYLHFPREPEILLRLLERLGDLETPPRCLKSLLELLFLLIQ